MMLTTPTIIDEENLSSIANKIQELVLSLEDYIVNNEEEELNRKVSLIYRDIYGSDIKLDLNNNYDFFINDKGDIDLCGVVTGKTFDSIIDFVHQNVLIKILNTSVYGIDLGKITMESLIGGDRIVGMSNDEVIKMLHLELIAALSEIPYIDIQQTSAIKYDINNFTRTITFYINISLVTSEEIKLDLGVVF